MSDQSNSKAVVKSDAHAKQLTHKNPRYATERKAQVSGNTERNAAQPELHFKSSLPSLMVHPAVAEQLSQIHAILCSLLFASKRYMPMISKFERDPPICSP